MVSNLTATGVNIKWYNVTTGGTELSPSNLLTSGTYYVSQTFNGTESERVAVEVITDCASTLTAASPCGITASSDNKTFTAIDDPKAMSYEFFLDGNPQGEQSSNEKRFNSAITPATRVTVKYYYPSEFLKPKMIYVEGSASLTATGWKYGEYVNNTKTKALVSNFYMSETTITQAQYEYVMGINPSYFQCSRTFPSPAGDVTYAPSSDKPVESINCPDLMAFCNKLSIMEGKTPCYSFVDIPALNLANGTEGWVNLAYDEISSLHYTQAPEWHKVTCNFAADGYRLPTATEWEYAAHDGVKNSNYYFSGGGTGSSDTDAIDTLVWCRSNNDEQTQAVKGKKPNALGLYSMSGNILEFCWEWDKNPSDGKYTPASTPTGTIATSGSWYRIARGGYWNSSSANCRVAPVNGLTADSRSNTHGFRVVCSAP
jgi:formylglycine-generating enzyme required for sulfatase activity